MTERLGLKRHDLPRNCISAHLPQVGAHPGPWPQLEEGAWGSHTHQGPHLVATLPPAGSSLSCSLVRVPPVREAGPRQLWGALRPLGVQSALGPQGCPPRPPRAVPRPGRGETPVALCNQRSAGACPQARRQSSWAHFPQS